MGSQGCWSQSQALLGEAWVQPGWFAQSIAGSQHTHTPIGTTDATYTPPPAMPIQVSTSNKTSMETHVYTIQAFPCSSIGSSYGCFQTPHTKRVAIERAIQVES